MDFPSYKMVIFYSYASLPEGSTVFPFWGCHITSEIKYLLESVSHNWVGWCDTLGHVPTPESGKAVAPDDFFVRTWIFMLGCADDLGYFSQWETHYDWGIDSRHVFFGSLNPSIGWSTGKELRMPHKHSLGAVGCCVVKGKFSLG